MTIPSDRPLHGVKSQDDADYVAESFARELPDAEDLAYEQTVNAVYRIHEDSSDYPRFPLKSLDNLLGYHAPDELWFFYGRQGNGKSLFLQNWAHWLVEQGIAVLYIGTEQDADTLRIKQACVKVGVNPRDMLKPRPEVKNSPWWIRKSDEVQQALKWLESPEIRPLLTFANTRYVNRQLLAKWVAGGVRKYGIQYAIVDHIDHMDHGEGKNAPGELKASVHTFKDLLCTYHICGMAASQVKRAGDPLKNFMPPEVDDGFGGSSKEHTADGILGAWRPLRDDLEPKDLRALLEQAKMGHAPGDTVFKPDTMGVRVLKDRLGDAPGKQAMVGVSHGRLVELPERDRHKTTWP